MTYCGIAAKIAAKQRSEVGAKSVMVIHLEEAVLQKETRTSLR